MESFLTDWGYAALILFGFLEAACIPISSEITFGFAGVLAYQGHLNLALVIIIGSLGNPLGTVLGGVIYGVSYMLMQSYYSSWANLLPYVLLIAILLVRPSGLLGRQVRRA